MMTTQKVVLIYNLQCVAPMSSEVVTTVFSSCELLKLRVIFIL